MSNSGQAQAIEERGQRVATFFTYLNNVPVDNGGETDFPKIFKLKVRPRKNTAVLWFNIRANGREDPRVLHAGLPVQGDLEKWGMNIWVRHPGLVSGTGAAIPCREWHEQYEDESW